MSIYCFITVTPSLTSTLFAIDSSTSILALARTFEISEVPNGEFVIEIIATDSLSQTVSEAFYNRKLYNIKRFAYNSIKNNLLLHTARMLQRKYMKLSF